MYDMINSFNKIYELEIEDNMVNSSVYEKIIVVF